MCVVTAVLRFSGYWLMRRVTLSPRVAGALEALPGSAVASLLLPLMVNEDLSATIAVLITAFLMMILRREMVVLACGICVAAGLRALGL